MQNITTGVDVIPSDILATSCGTATPNSMKSTTLVSLHGPSKGMRCGAMCALNDKPAGLARLQPSGTRGKQLPPANRNCPARASRKARFRPEGRVALDWRQHRKKQTSRFESAPGLPELCGTRKPTENAFQPCMHGGGRACSNSLFAVLRARSVSLWNIGANGSKRIQAGTALFLAAPQTAPRAKSSFRPPPLKARQARLKWPLAAASGRQRHTTEAGAVAACIFLC